MSVSPSREALKRKRRQKEMESSSAMDMGQMLLTAFDTSMSKYWGEKDRRWRAGDRKWREDDLNYREEERQWRFQEKLMQEAEIRWIKFYYSPLTAYLFIGVVVVSIIVWLLVQYFWGGYLSTGSTKRNEVLAECVQPVGLPFDWHLAPGVPPSQQGQS